MVAAALVLALLQDPLPRDDGYRGIWYINQPSKDEFKYKYSDGNALAPFESALYFTNRAGDHVWRLPHLMSGDHQKPEVAW